MNQNQFYKEFEYESVYTNFIDGTPSVEYLVFEVRLEDTNGNDYEPEILGLTDDIIEAYLKTGYFPLFNRADSEYRI